MLCGSLSLWVSLTVIKHQRISAALLQWTMCLTVLLLYPCLPAPNCPAWQRRHSRTNIDAWVEPLRQWISAVICFSAGARVWLFGLEGGRCLDFSSSSLQPHSVLTSCLYDSTALTCSESKRSSLSGRQTGVEWGLELKLLGFKKSQDKKYTYSKTSVS